MKKKLLYNLSSIITELYLVVRTKQKTSITLVQQDELLSFTIQNFVDL